MDNSARGTRFLIPGWGVTCEANDAAHSHDESCTTSTRTTLWASCGTLLREVLVIGWAGLHMLW